MIDRHLNSWHKFVYLCASFMGTVSLLKYRMQISSSLRNSLKICCLRYSLLMESHFSPAVSRATGVAVEEGADEATPAGCCMGVGL